MVTQRETLRISYVIGTYPSLTTTFIDREIEAVRAMGVDVAVLALKRSPGVLSPEQRRLAEGVRYLLPPRPGTVAAAVAWSLLRHPRASLVSLLFLMRAPHGRAPRHRTLLHLLEGFGAAWLLRDRVGVPLHAHFVDRAATVALVAARLLGTSYSMTAHANDIYVDPVLLPEKVSGGTFVATCTEHNRDHLVRTLGSWSEGRVRTIRHGLDLGRFEPSGTTRAGTPLLVAVAQLKEKKGLGHLVAACAGLRDMGVDVHCEIAGDGPLREQLENAIDASRLRGRVTLLGAIPASEVIALMDRATLFVLPSVIAADGDRDGIPNVILEAMAMGLPVISTPISGIPEVVADGETGRLVPPGDHNALRDSIASLLADDATRAAYGAEARRRVLAEFDVQNSARRLVGAWRASGG
jgi:colanic acid/amylovoran biosynthesis glycosyltransferase